MSAPTQPGSSGSTAVGRSAGARRPRGFTLIELMISLLLGLVVIAGVVSVFIASQQSYRTNEALSDIQDGSRIAFELMARDIREAGLTGCDSKGNVANVLDDTTDWFANWGNALVGYEGGATVTDPALKSFTGTGKQVANTDSVELLGAGDLGLTVVSHNPTSATFKINKTSGDLESGDIAIVCDPNHTAIFQITNYNNSNVSVEHNTGNGVANPGNYSKGLGYPPVKTTNGNKYEFGANSQLTKLTAVDWYIGTNADGGKSLYRVDVETVSGVPKGVAQEMVRNVTDMQIKYHSSSESPATFVDAGTITKWGEVDAVQVTLTLQSTDQRAGTDQKPLERTFTSTTTVRNRVS